MRSFWLNAEMSRSMSANAPAIDYVLRIAALHSTARSDRTLTPKLSGACPLQRKLGTHYKMAVVGLRAEIAIRFVSIFNASPNG